MAVTAPGSPYVESSDLVANYPGVSESLAERVDLVGVLPFADSTARGTALPTPTDGQYSYLQDTNATEYYNGSAWVAAGVTPGLTHINTTTFSAVSSVSLDGVFTSGYENYLIMLSCDLTSGNQQLRARLRVSSTDATGNNYTRQLMSADGAAASFSKATETSFRLGGSNSASISLTQLTMWRPALAAKTGFQVFNEGAFGSANLNILSGSHSLSTAYDGITIYPAASTITGTIRVYGYKNGA